MILNRKSDSCGEGNCVHAGNRMTLHEFRLFYVTRFVIALYLSLQNQDNAMIIL